MEWIKVTDRLPEGSIQEVICYLNSPTHKLVLPMTWRLEQFMYFNGDYTDMTKKITHWMPLPSPPNE